MSLMTQLTLVQRLKLAQMIMANTILVAHEDGQKTGLTREDHEMFDATLAEAVALVEEKCDG